MLYTKLLRERIKASCVGVMLWRLLADSSYLWGYPLYARAPSGNGICLLFVFGLFFALLSDRKRIHYSAYYSSQI